MSSKRAGRMLADVMSEIGEDLTATPVLAAVPLESESPAIVPINILVAPEDRKRLRQLSLDSGLSLQKLGHEAWNRLLAARGLQPLKAVAANVPSGRNRR